ncbi:Transcriptional regulator, AcrR family [hydrothermal vent metagenome]|uniref:Transcriptional regulator, AcrR family n=1 Tax=hydrothermal vent metagenome TaxID=652676 RepID=A0A3B0YZC3_9ZZZZ
MPKKSDKKVRLLAAARELFHCQGFANTTLSDISKMSGVPLGNVYYYFKTKQELVLTIIEQKVAEYEIHFEQWEKEAPRSRLKYYIEQYEQISDLIKVYGCPDGCLSLELNKENPELSAQANILLSQQLTWVTTQFSKLGRPDARTLALHLMTSLQGSSLLASVLHDKAILTDEIVRLKGLVGKIK